MDEVAPGRLQATLLDTGAGLYTFLVTTASGTQRRLHLRRHRAENESWGISPALTAWRADGLIEDRDPGRVTRSRDAGSQRRALDRSLLMLALALFLCGVLVDRATLQRPSVQRILQRLRVP